MKGKNRVRFVGFREKSTNHFVNITLFPDLAYEQVNIFKRNTVCEKNRKQWKEPNKQS